MLTRDEIPPPAVDALAEEQQSLHLIIALLHSHAADHPRAATTAEAMELLDMLPRLLRAAITPDALQQKERQRERGDFGARPRPAPLLGHTVLYRLLFAQTTTPVVMQQQRRGHVDFTHSQHDIPHSDGSVLHGGGLGGGVLACVARLICQPRRSKLGLVAPSLCALRGIVQLCLSPPMHDGKKDDRNPAAVASHAHLLDALRHALRESGLFEYLWRQLLLDTRSASTLSTMMGDVGETATTTIRGESDVPSIREVIAEVLGVLSGNADMGIAVLVEYTRHSTPPSLWGERAAELILTEPIVPVRAAIALALDDSMRHSASGRGDWRRWITKTAFGRLLGVVAMGAPISVLHPTLSALCRATQQTLQKTFKPNQPVMGSFVLEPSDMAEVAAGALVQRFTAPLLSNSALERQEWRLLVIGAVRLLRLVLRVVDEVLSNAPDEAHRVLRVFVEKQTMPTALRFLEWHKGSKEAICLTSKMRSELVRLVRDLVERASPPMFLLSERLVPYFPLILQAILDTVGQSNKNNAFIGSDDLESMIGDDATTCKRTSSDIFDPSLCHIGMELVSLLGVILWHSPSVRQRFVDTLSALQCSQAEQHVLFDLLENMTRAVPLQAMQGLLLVDISGVVLNDPSRLRWMENATEPRVPSMELLVRMQERKLTALVAKEDLWTIVQQQRSSIEGPMHSRAAHALLVFILCHIRSQLHMAVGGKDCATDGLEMGNGDGDHVCIPSLSPDHHEVGSTAALLSPIPRNTSGGSVDVSYGTTHTHVEMEDAMSNQPLLTQKPSLERDAERENAKEEKKRWSCATNAEVSRDMCLYRQYGIPPPIPTRPQPAPPVKYRPAKDLSEDEFQMCGTGLSSSPEAAETDSLAPMDPMRCVRRHQLAAMAAERLLCQSALTLLIALASRYYRQHLSPDAALAFVQRSRGGPNGSVCAQTATVRTERDTFGAGRRSGGTALRLWTPGDVRRGDLFTFSIPISALDAAAVESLVADGRRHQNTLRRALRTTPHSARGRRWFLEDASTNIMGRVIALARIMRGCVQREGVEAVRAALTKMPAEEGVYGTTREWNNGNMLHAVRFVLQCFPHSAAEETDVLGIVLRPDME